MATRRRDGEGSGWVATALGTVLLVSVGFGVGLLAGLVWSEPELVVGHLAGRSEVVDWDEGVDPGALAARDVAAAGDAEGIAEPAWASTAQVDASAGIPDRTELAAAEPTAPPAPDPQPVAAPAPGPVAAAPPPASPRSSAITASGDFAVQVGAFADDQAARKVANELRSKGFPVYVKPAGADGRWRVRVGPVASRGEAEALAGRLKQGERLPTWVLREEGV